MSTLSSSKVGAVTLMNTGDITEETYKTETGIPPSYDAKYYDVWYPFNKTYADIGGWCKKGLYANSESSTGSGMSERVQKSKVGGENGVCYECECKSIANFKGSIDNSELCAKAVDKAGNEYYVSAVHGYTLNIKSDDINGPAQKPAYYGWYHVNGNHDGGIRGTPYDVILTDGTVLHFIVGDVQALDHTMGWKAGKGDFAVGEGLHVDNVKLNYKQYKYGWGAQPGHIIEIQGDIKSVDDFRNKYLKKANIAYLRFYNFYADEGKKRINGYTKSWKDSIDNVSVGKGSDQGEKQTESKVSLEKKAIKDEWELHGMPEKSHLADDQQYVELPNGFENSQDEINTVGIKENINYRSENTIGYWSRVIVASLGLFLLIYIILLVACWLFDRSNIVLDFSLVEMLTLGLVKPTREEIKEGVLLSTGRLVRICVIIFCVAALLISGGVFDVLQRLLNWVMGIFS